VAICNFKKLKIDIAAGEICVPFKNLDTADRFKKYKLASSFLVSTSRIAFSSDPTNDKKSIKAALGIKIGALLNVHTKGKTFKTKMAKPSIPYTLKENKKNFQYYPFIINRKIGIGHFSLFGSYAFTNIFKDGVLLLSNPFKWVFA
jgi:hypothetical protein